MKMCIEFRIFNDGAMQEQCLVFTLGFILMNGRERDNGTAIKQTALVFYVKRL